MSSLLIDAAALAAALDGPAAPFLVDARPSAAFASGHLEGAVHLDVFGMSLVDTRPDPLRAFEWMAHHLLELRGITRERPVVAYEENAGMRAARVWWLLRLFGHPDVRVLDGGLGAWRADGRRLVRDAVDPAPSTLVVARDPSVLATVEDVVAALARPDVTIVDTRSEDEYAGRLVRAARGGAIPGAVHLEWTRTLAADGRYLAPAALRALYADAGVDPSVEVITYCQGGYRAAQSQIALLHAGYARVRCYLGSWNEWGNRTDLPIASPR